MHILENRQWISDLDETISGLPELKAFAGSSILITGSTGLIGSAITDILIRWNTVHDLRITIFAAGRNEEKIRARFAPFQEEAWLSPIVYDATAPENRLPSPCDFIIHGAGNASPNRIMKEPVETMLSNFLGLKNLLEHAEKQKTKRILYISSSEIYGRKEGELAYRENEYGYIDLLNPRNSYSVAKRAAETLCASYADEYGVDSVIVRPGHIYGPTALETDNRVSSAWAYAAARGEDILMKSTGAQLRSYCYCLDCGAAILTVLLKGESVHSYNISNPDSIISIRQMAEILAQSAGVGLITELPTKQEKKAFNPMSNSSLDSTSLLQLGWKGQFDAEIGFSHTVRILRELYTSGEDGKKT